MRDQQQLLRSFMPKHEKEYEVKLFVDEAIKSSAEYHLQTIANAMCGDREVKLHYGHNERVEHIKSDSGKWFTKTTKYKIKASMEEWSFYGDTLTEIYVSMIGFFDRRGIFPCG